MRRPRLAAGRVSSLPARRIQAWAAGAAVAGALLLASALAAGGGPQDPSSAEAMAARAAARIKDLQREADSLASRERTLLEEIRKLEVERDLRAEEYTASTLDLQRIERELDDTAVRIAGLEQAAESQLPDLAARMVELYKVGNGGYLRMLMSVDDLRDMGRAYRFVSGLQGLDRRRVAEHRRTLADLRKAQASLEGRRSQASLAQAAVARARDAAAQAVTAHADLISRIDERRDLASQLMGELEAARQRLQGTIDDAALGRPREAGAVIGLPLRPFKGDIEWPVTGTVSGGFGRQVNRKFHTSVVSNGIRIAAAASTPVTAVHDGTVAYATAFTGFGNLVIIDHGSVAFSLYGYLADIDVVSGERVAQGQRLGSVGTSLEGEPSLYFELRIDGKPVDPLQWLKRK
ncbi:MAG: peptidoglycan DD-metalloendopeptidase family protein [Vicinamibacterales bacterium]|jgi:septal ring factor EnvC (AmiA/AmiB activator)|nr:peptidoglycan DD-metalloendopeptidase family protein [Vicinamibacterales bacterium]